MTDISKFYDEKSGVYYDVADAEAREDVGDLKNALNIGSTNVIGETGIYVGSVKKA